MLLSLPRFYGSRSILEALSYTPFLSLFRTAYQRFSFVIALSLSLLIPYSINEISKLWPNKKFVKYTSFAFIALILINAYPLYLGKMFEANKYLSPEQVSIPAYYKESAEWMKENSSSKNPRVLVLPYNSLGLATLYDEESGFHYDSSHPYRLMDNLSLMYADAGNNFSSYFDKFIYREGALVHLINQYQLNYIVFHNDANWNYVYDNSWWDGTNSLKMKELLSNDPCIASINNFKQLEIYTVKEECRKSRPLLPYSEIPSLNVYLKSMAIVDNNIYLNAENSTAESSIFSELKMADVVNIDDQSFTDIWPNATYSPASITYKLVKIKENYSLLMNGDSEGKMDSLIWLMAKRAEELDSYQGINAQQRESVANNLSTKTDELRVLIGKYEDRIEEDQVNKLLFYLKRINKLLAKHDQAEITNSKNNIARLENEVETLKGSRLYSLCKTICYRIDDEVSKTNLSVYDDRYDKVGTIDSVGLIGDGRFRVFENKNKLYLEDNLFGKDLLINTPWLKVSEFLSNPFDNINLEFQHTKNELINFDSDLSTTNAEYKVLKDVDISKEYYLEYSYKISDPQYKFTFLLAEQVYDYTKPVEEAQTKLKLYKKNTHVYKEYDDYSKVKILYKPSELLAKDGQVYLIFSLNRVGDDKLIIDENLPNITDIKDLKFYEIPHKSLYVTDSSKPFYKFDQPKLPSSDNQYKLERINPFTYKVWFTELSQNDQLFILNDKYHSEWKFIDYQGDNNIVYKFFNAVLPFKYYEGKELDLVHKKVNSLYNGWVINDQNIEANKDYYIVFTPQAYLLQSLVIGFGIILLSVTLSALAFFMRIKEK